MTSGRSQEKKGRNVTNRFMYYVYILSVEAGFSGDTGRVIDSFTKLSNVHLG